MGDTLRCGGASVEEGHPSTGGHAQNIFEWVDTLPCEGRLSRVRLTPSLKGKKKKGTLTETETGTKIETDPFPGGEEEEGNPD